MEFLFELNTGREIPFLQATIYHFFSYINSVGLYQQEWRERRVTYQQLIGDIKQTKKIIVINTCAVPVFLRAGNPC